MRYEKTKDIELANISCSRTERHLPPTDQAIKAMKDSFKSGVGQISPIIVYLIAAGQYRVVAGAVRFIAARELFWETIRVTVISGSAADYEICELEENLERRELTAEQRREMKARIKVLRSEQAQRLAAVEPGQPGRGKKGGLAEAAREESVPRSTAQRMAKSAHYTDSGQISEPTGLLAPHKVMVSFTEGEVQNLRAWCEPHGLNMSDGVRKLTREGIARDEQPKPHLRVVK